MDRIPIQILPEMKATYPISANSNGMIGDIFAITQNLYLSTDKYLDEFWSYKRGMKCDETVGA